MATGRTCVDCGRKCAGTRCAACNKAYRKAKADIRTCCVCGKELHSQTKGDRCSAHRYGHVERVLVEEAAVAPSLPGVPSIFGEFIVLSDPHIPFHSPNALLRACEAAQTLGVKKLVIGGDLLHADIISKYDKGGHQVRISDELVACGRVLRVLTTVFDEIHIIMGNHDRRMEKLVASWRNTSSGAKALELVAKMLDVPEDADQVAYGIMEQFFGNDKVTIYPLPDLTINNTWLVLHPGSCSRVPPQTERKMIHKHRKSVIGTHNHLVGFGFDDSGIDLAANIGHCADNSKFRYVREQQTTFPQCTINCFCAILTDEDSPEGRLLPLVIHKRWFDLGKLAERLERNHER